VVVDGTVDVVVVDRTVWLWSLTEPWWLWSANSSELSSSSSRCCVTGRVVVVHKFHVVVVTPHGGMKNTCDFTVVIFEQLTELLLLRFVEAFDVRAGSAMRLSVTTPQRPMLIANS